MIPDGQAANNPPGGPAMSVLPACANCSSSLSGPYCAHCGQKATDLHKPIWWIAGEFLDAVFSFDSRTFRTIWLLFGEPGEFTRRYNEGQRASLLPPFRLFLIATVIFFVALQLTGLALVTIKPKTVVLDPNAPGQAEALKEMKQDGLQISADGKTVTGVEMDFFVPIDSTKPHTTLTAEQRKQFEDGRAALRKEAEKSTDPNEAAMWGSVAGYSDRVMQGFERAVDDPLKLNGALNVWLPRVMLLLVPVFAFLLAIMHWRPRVYYVEHLIFALHIHTVIFFALAIVVLAVGFFGDVGFLSIALGPILAVYLWMAMKKVYGRGVFFTSLKFAVILMVYSTILTASLGIAFMQALSEV